jgi:hypothetical protein
MMWVVRFDATEPYGRLANGLGPTSARTLQEAGESKLTALVLSLASLRMVSSLSHYLRSAVENLAVTMCL